MASEPSRAADPERCHHERVVSGAAPEPVLDQERDEHLERPHHHQDHHGCEEQGGEQPRGPDHVDEALAHVRQDRRDRVGGGVRVEVTADRRLGHQGQGEEPGAGARGGDRDGRARGQGADEETGERGAGGLADGRTHHAFEAVDRHQVGLGDERGQPGGVGGVVERHPHPGDERDGREVPDLG